MAGSMINSRASESGDPEAIYVGSGKGDTDVRL